MGLYSNTIRTMYETVLVNRCPRFDFECICDYKLIVQALMTDLTEEELKMAKTLEDFLYEEIVARMRR